MPETNWHSRWLDVLSPLWPRQISALMHAMTLAARHPGEFHGQSVQTDVAVRSRSMDSLRLEYPYHVGDVYAALAQAVRSRWTNESRPPGKFGCAGRPRGLALLLVQVRASRGA